ncbi:hypothetical protein [Flaviaesturariibacter terrae]
MKKTILALVTLLGTGAMGWAQNTTTTGTSGSTTTNSNTTTTKSNMDTSINGNAPTTDNISTGSSGTNSNSGSMVNPGNSNTTGTLQSSTTAGVDYNTQQNPQNPQNTQGTLQSNSNYAAYGTATVVPGNLNSSFQRDYPTAFSPTWQQSGDWYRASFNNMNRNMMVYYAPNGNSYSVALPVLNGYIPEEVITKALSTYGNNLYSISRVKAANGQDAFQINTIDGGIARTEFIGEDGSSFAAIDVFRHDEDNMANGEMQNSSSNAAISDSTTTTTRSDSSDMNMVTPNPSTSTQTTTDTSTQTSTSVEGTMNTDNSSMNATKEQDPKFKHKVKTEDGRKLKIKTKKGDTKVKGDALDATGGQ